MRAERADQRFEQIWRVPDAQVASGRIPGYVAAVRLPGTDGGGSDGWQRTRVQAGGRTATEPGSAPMSADTQFRIASVTKPIGAALTLSLVQDGALSLDDPIARWLPEMARPRVLVSPDAPRDRTTEAAGPITVLTQREMTGPDDGFGDFWAAVAVAVST